MSTSENWARLDRMRAAGARRPLMRLAWPFYGLWLALSSGLLAASAYAGGMLYFFAAMHRFFYPQDGLRTCLQSAAASAGESGLLFGAFGLLVGFAILGWRVVRGRKVVLEP